MRLLGECRLAPLTGRLIPLTEVPDPVFAAEMVGPGVAVDPDPGEPVTVVSPIAGTWSSCTRTRSSCAPPTSPCLSTWASTP